MSSVFFLGAGRKISLHFPASCGILLEREIKSPGVVQLIERVVWDHEAASLSLATRTSSEIPITATFPPCGENCAMMGISSLFAHKRFAGLRAEERGAKDGGGKIECIPRIERGGTIPNRNRAALLWMEENQDIFSGTGCGYPPRPCPAPWPGPRTPGPLSGGSGPQSGRITVSPAANDAFTSISRWFLLPRKGRVRDRSASTKGPSTSTSTSAKRAF